MREVLLVLGEERDKRLFLDCQDDARAEVALQAVAFDLLEDESTRVISIRRTLRRDQSEPNRTGLAIDKIGIDLVVVEGW